MKVNNIVKRKKNFDLIFGDDCGKFYVRVFGFIFLRGYCEWGFLLDYCYYGDVIDGDN